MYSMEVEMFMDDYKESLAKAIDHYGNELVQIRAGRANPKIIERLYVDYYGSMTPISQMANISVPEARMLLVSVWDMSAVKSVVKAIKDANLGINPSDDGKVIRLVFPQLTEDRRREIVKDINKLTESAKVTCRNSRRDILDECKKMKKDGNVTEDEMTLIEKDVQKMLDQSIEKISHMSETKEKEIMEV